MNRLFMALIGWGVLISTTTYTRGIVDPKTGITTPCSLCKSDSIKHNDKKWKKADNFLTACMIATGAVGGISTIIKPGTYTPFSRITINYFPNVLYPVSSPKAVPTSLKNNKFIQYFNKDNYHSILISKPLLVGTSFIATGLLALAKLAVKAKRARIHHKNLLPFLCTDFCS